MNDTDSSYTTATTHAASVIDAGRSNQMCDLSPLSDQSSSSIARIKTKHRLNSKQKQEQRVADLAHWNWRIKKVLLYTLRREQSREGGCPTKKEKIIKTKFKGVGPSLETIR